MSRTIEKTPFMWEKGTGDKCRPGPKSCLPRARPVLGASVSEWHKAVRWVSRGTEAGWRVPMPSSRRDGSEGKWMCPPFLNSGDMSTCLRYKERERSCRKNTSKGLARFN